MREVRVTNMTSLFSKEMLMYSFFDIRLKSPVRVTQILYFVVLFLIIGVPVFWLTWPPNVYTVFIGIGIPFGGSYFMSKPIWNGKSFFSYMKTQIKYFSRPKSYYDWKAGRKETEYKIDTSIQVSRHEDFNILYKIIRDEEEMKYGKKIFN